MQFDPEMLLYYSSDVLASAALLLILTLARLIAGRALIRRDNLSPQEARRWTVNVRNALLTVAVVGLVMIWAPQLRTFALSLTAVAVAVVVATKELILCLSGSAFRTFTSAYSIGDFVQIGATRGEVIDYNLLATRLMEFEKREGSIVPTGKIVVVPHSLLFTGAIQAEQETHGKIQHSFNLVFEAEANLLAQHQDVEKAAIKAFAPFLGEHSDAAGKACDLALHFGTTDIGKQYVSMSFLSCPDEAAATQQALSRAIGSLIQTPN